ncbi:ShlB/FhaC/HecB family hemolysin secretion/activation protein [Rivularia sp. PCC 7116]|uniref:ShlB/FhaC/HecB family hemolysin secretion/activation protein n=1 Tax=Rivularia sp. PCC 7116 TaxID=373994 RepID=UPI0002E587E2|nr:ShlB/FhaC/HecB family hemolysin secretion/activation protein [Rivularia sp. PCC 7116]
MLTKFYFNGVLSQVILFTSFFFINKLLDAGVVIAQVPSLEEINSFPPPQDIQPLPNPPETTPKLPDSQEKPLQLPSPEKPTQVDEATQSNIVVTDFKFIGNTVFTDEELAKIFIDSGDINQPIALSKLLQIAVNVTALYHQHGYKTSGAVVRIPELTQQQGRGEVEIRVVEGQLQQIDIRLLDSPKKGRLAKYLRQRLGIKDKKPLNVDRLLQALQLLQIDPLFETISATINPGTEQGSSLLTVKYSPAQSFNPQLSLNNSRSPSVGSFQREVGFRQNNLLGFGDNLTLAYNNSDGSNGVNVGYSLPINSKNGTLGFGYSQNDNDVIEPPFKDLNGDGDSPDIESESRSYEVSYRQPIIRTVENNSFKEFSLGLTASLRESKSFLLDTPFPLSPGAEEDGSTRIAALRFSQEYQQQDSQQVIALRSQFNFGINALNSTINEDVAGVEPIPDSRFFSWQGQAQYVRRLAADSLFLIRGNAQLTTSALLLSEQFAVGGLGSVRGYRQDQLLTDNGVFISAAVELPVIRRIAGNGILQIVPFIDYGTTWNSRGRSNPDKQTLSSFGMGLQYIDGDNFRARLDWGIPLVSVNSRKRTWQENGIYFTLQYNP